MITKPASWNSPAGTYICQNSQMELYDASKSIVNDDSTCAND